MHIDKLKKVEIKLYDDDVGLMRVIIKLAADQLNNSEVTHMRGSGIPVQAGLFGGPLLEMRTMIENIAMAVEADITLSDLSIPRQKFSTVSSDMSIVEVKS